MACCSTTPSPAAHPGPTTATNCVSNHSACAPMGAPPCQVRSVVMLNGGCDTPAVERLLSRCFARLAFRAGVEGPDAEVARLRRDLAVPELPAACRHLQ